MINYDSICLHSAFFLQKMQKLETYEKSEMQCLMHSIVNHLSIKVQKINQIVTALCL